MHTVYFLIYYGLQSKLPTVYVIIVNIPASRGQCQSFVILNNSDEEMDKKK